MFAIAPVIQAAYFSLYKWNGLEPLTNLIWCDNFINIFKDEVFYKALFNNFQIIFFSLGIKYIFLSIFAFIVLIPIFITMIGGLKSLPQLKLDLFGLPNPVAWKNLTDVLDISRSKFYFDLFNSSFITIFTVFIDLAMSRLAGFALSRIKFPGRELGFNYFLLGLLFPLSVAILPLYIEIKNIGLLDNYFGVILPQVAFGMPWHIMLAQKYIITGLTAGVIKQ